MDGKTVFDILAEVIVELRGPDGRASSREKSLAVTKLQEALFWLVEDEKRNQAQPKT